MKCKHDWSEPINEHIDRYTLVTYKQCYKCGELGKVKPTKTSR